MSALKRFRALYGAGPLHLLALLASFAIAGAAVVGWFQRPRDVVSVLEWFAAAIVIHDLVLLPLYSLLDRIAFGVREKRVDRARGATVLGLVTATPYIRIPAILSGLLLAVFFPVIFGLGAQTQASASGIAESGYLARWLLASGAMFAVSGVAYATALARVRAARQSTARVPIRPPPDSDQITSGGDPPALSAVGGDHTTPGDDALESAPDQSSSDDDAAPAPPPG